MSVGDFNDANGVQVVDWIGTFSEVMPGEKARLTIRDGVLVMAEGVIGEMFWKALETVDDPNVYRLAELAVGMNPYTRKGLTSLGAPNLPMTVPPYHEVKQSEGTVHTAFGDSGGRILQEGETGIIEAVHRRDLVHADPVRRRRKIRRGRETAVLDAQTIPVSPLRRGEHLLRKAPPRLGCKALINKKGCYR
jgi:hypothetical protein